MTHLLLLGKMAIIFFYWPVRMIKAKLLFIEWIFDSMFVNWELILQLQKKIRHVISDGWKGRQSTNG